MAIFHSYVKFPESTNGNQVIQVVNEGATWRQHGTSETFCSQWVDLRENLQETIDFPMKSWEFPVIFPLNQPIDAADLHSLAGNMTVCTRSNLWNPFTSCKVADGCVNH